MIPDLFLERTHCISMLVFSIDVEGLEYNSLSTGAKDANMMAERQTFVFFWAFCVSGAG